MQFTFRVTVADGDNFAAGTTTSTIHVIADTMVDARLAADQMATTPMIGKPSHPQIVNTQLVDVLI